MTNKEILEAIVNLRAKLADARKLTLKIRQSIKHEYINWVTPNGNILLNIRTHLVEADNLALQVTMKLLREKGR